jgi:hypothetical protein
MIRLTNCYIFGINGAANLSIDKSMSYNLSLVDELCC